MGEAYASPMEKRDSLVAGLRYLMGVRARANWFRRGSSVSNYSY
jgi:hypothetical protein